MRIVAFVGDILELESLFLLSTFLKILGSSEVSIFGSTVKKDKDLPFFQNLNNTFFSIGKIKVFALISVDPRKEEQAEHQMPCLLSNSRLSPDN